MYKKTIFTLLRGLAPIGIIEQHKKDKSSQITTQKFHMIEKNNENKDIAIKNCKEEKDLGFQKRYFSNSEKIFITTKR